MSETINKPYVLKAAEIIYFKISEFKKINPNISLDDAIKKFIETDDYEKLSSGEFHNQWLVELKKNNYIDNETNQKIPNETIRLLEIQRDMMIKELIKIPKLYDSKSSQLIELSKKASNFLWRMCESYELWCKESNQDNLIILNISN